MLKNQIMVFNKLLQDQSEIMKKEFSSGILSVFLPNGSNSNLCNIFVSSLLMRDCSSGISRSSMWAINVISGQWWIIRVMPNIPSAIGQTALGRICWQPSSHFNIWILVKCSEWTYEQFVTIVQSEFCWVYRSLRLDFFIYTRGICINHRGNRMDIPALWLF